MSFKTLFLILISSAVLLFSYLLISLNREVISLDLFFFELTPSLGPSLLVFFLIGALLTLVLEATFFLGKKGKGGKK